MAEIIEMPKMTDTMDEGLIVDWHKKVGDEVSSGDILAEVETDKATMELESYFDGTLLYIGVEGGNTIAVGALLAIVGEKDEDVQSIIDEYKNKASAAETSSDAAASETPQPAAQQAEAPSPPASPQPAPAETQASETTDGRIKASPLAKALARERGIDISHVTGSGDGGRVVKRDIEQYLENQPTAVPQSAPMAAPAPAGGDGGESYEDIPLTQMRKAIAKRLSESKNTAPHYYLTMSVNMDKAFEIRQQLKEETDEKISFNDMIVKSVALALRKHPQVNASWVGDAIRFYHHIHVGVAVAIDDGLIVPVIRFADTKGLTDIARESKDLAQKARDRQLQPEDYTGNTFSISNLGMFGIEQFTAIINPPDSCILAVGAIQDEPIVKNGVIVPGKIMRMTLSNDHRVVDGAIGSAFLQTVKFLLENPLRMLL